MSPDDYAGLENETLGPEDEVPPNRRPKQRQETRRLPHLPGPHVRVPLQWIQNPCRPHIFATPTRLFLYLLYRSYWGQRGVVVTNATAAELGISARRKQQIIVQLESTGWVRVQREGRRALVVWPIVTSG